MKQEERERGDRGFHTGETVRKGTEREPTLPLKGAPLRQGRSTNSPPSMAYEKRDEAFIPFGEIYPDNQTGRRRVKVSKTLPLF